MKLPLVTFFSGVTIACATDVPITQDELVHRTQELYDAIVPGNQAPWKKYFAEDCIFADEKRRLFDKPKLIADITPMPAGYSGTIKIENAQSRIIGNTAILSYDADETETIFGQNLKARYHITDTWLQRKAIGRSSPARHIATTKIRPWEKPIRKSLLTTSAPTNWRPDKRDSSLPKARNSSSNATVRRSNCSRKRQRFSSAKGSKAESCFVTLPPAKSTL